MKNLANELFPENDEFANDMFILGLLHDVGYEFTTAQEEHADVAVSMDLFQKMSNCSDLRIIQSLTRFV